MHTIHAKLIKKIWLNTGFIKRFKRGGCLTGLSNNLVWAHLALDRPLRLQLKFSSYISRLFAWQHPAQRTQSTGGILPVLHQSSVSLLLVVHLYGMGRPTAFWNVNETNKNTTERNYSPFCRGVQWICKSLLGFHRSMCTGTVDL